MESVLSFGSIFARSAVAVMLLSLLISLLADLASTMHMPKVQKILDPLQFVSFKDGWISLTNNWCLSCEKRPKEVVSFDIILYFIDANATPSYMQLWSLVKGVNPFVLEYVIAYRSEKQRGRRRAPGRPYMLATARPALKIVH